MQPTEEDSLQGDVVQVRNVSHLCPVNRKDVYFKYSQLKLCQIYRQRQCLRQVQHCDGDVNAVNGNGTLLNADVDALATKNNDLLLK